MTVRKDHLKLLKSYSVMSFKGYLIWYHKTHPRAQRLNTYESVWKLLSQLYYDLCHKVVDSDVGEEVTNVCLLGGFSIRHAWLNASSISMGNSVASVA